MTENIPPAERDVEHELVERTADQGETRPADVAEQAERRPAGDQAERRPGLGEQAERR